MLSTGHTFFLIFSSVSSETYIITPDTWLLTHSSSRVLEVCFLIFSSNYFQVQRPCLKSPGSVSRNVRKETSKHSRGHRKNLTTHSSNWLEQLYNPMSTWPHEFSAWSSTQQTLLQISKSRVHSSSWRNIGNYYISCVMRAKILSDVTYCIADKIFVSYWPYILPPVYGLHASSTLHSVNSVTWPNFVNYLCDLQIRN